MKLLLCDWLGRIGLLLTGAVRHLAAQPFGRDRWLHCPMWVGWLVRYLDIYLFYVYGRSVRFCMTHSGAKQTDLPTTLRLMFSHLHMLKTCHRSHSPATVAVHRPCSSWSISRACWSHSSKPAQIQALVMSCMTISHIVNSCWLVVSVGNNYRTGSRSSADDHCHPRCHRRHFLLLLLQ